LSLTLFLNSASAIPIDIGFKIKQSTVNANQDAARALAKKLMQEAEKLYKQLTPESLLKAKQKCEEALIIWRQLGDKGQILETVNNLQQIYHQLGGKQKVLEYNNQALIFSILTTLLN
jgi:hypothetical protein